MSDAKKIELANALLFLIRNETGIEVNDNDTIHIDEPTLIRIDKEDDNSVMIFVDEQIK